MKYYCISETVDQYLSKLSPYLDEKPEKIRKNILACFQKWVLSKILPFKKVNSLYSNSYFPEPIHNFLLDHLKSKYAIKISGKEYHQIYRKTNREGGYRRIDLGISDGLYSFSEFTGGKAPDVSEAMALIKYYKKHNELPKDWDAFRKTYEVTAGEAKLRFNADGNNGMILYLPNQEPEYSSIEDFVEVRADTKEKVRDRIRNYDLEFGREILERRIMLSNFKFFNFPNRTEEWRKQMQIGFELYNKGYLREGLERKVLESNIGKRKFYVKDYSGGEDEIRSNIKLEKTNQSKLENKSEEITKKRVFKIIEKSDEFKEILSERENPDKFNSLLNELDKDIEKEILDFESIDEKGEE